MLGLLGLPAVLDGSEGEPEGKRRQWQVTFGLPSIKSKTMQGNVNTYILV